MRTAIHLPELGVGPILLSVWFADVGEYVYEGDRLVEVLADGATFDVSSPGTGRLAAKFVLVRDVLHPGQVLGEVELEDEDNE